MKFYTYANQYGNSILYRGFEDGHQVIEKVPFSPTLYVSGKNAKSGWRDLYNDTPLDPITFGDIKEAKAFLETYKDVEGIEVHGFQKFQYQFINNNFPGEIEYDIAKVDILTLDIETVDPDMERGFPDIATADTPIVTISLHSTRRNETLVYGFKEYIQQPEDEFTYQLFSDEKTMLRALVMYFQQHKPEIITGWNTDTFDVPYLINRINRELDDTWSKKLSPFNIVKEVMIGPKENQQQTYDIYGVIQLDYLLLYKKYGTYSAKESYALGFIANEELGETKVELPGTSFRDNYLNHHTLFVQYNAIDSVLVKKMETKLRLIEIAFAMAYMYKCNLADIFRTVAPWEVFIYNHLASNKIAVPPKRNGMKGHLEGAWVMQPEVGLHGWTMSFDFASLYPSIVRQWNISPETFKPAETTIGVFDWLAPDSIVRSEASALAASYGCTVAANGTMYDKTKKGVLPALMEYCMVGRKVAKKEMLKLESEYQKIEQEIARRESAS